MKSTEKAAGLDAKLAEIDSKRDAERRELWSGAVDLGLPDRKSTIVDAAPPKPTPHTQRPRALPVAGPGPARTAAANTPATPARDLNRRGPSKGLEGSNAESRKPMGPEQGFCAADLCRPRRYNVGAMVRTKRPCRLFAFRCSRGGGGALANPMAVGDATQTKDLNSKRCWIWLEWIEPSKRKTKSAEPTHHPKLRDAQAVSV